MQTKREKLLQIIEKAAKKDICVAFSGGIDSSLLLRLAQDAAKVHRTIVYAVTFDTVLHPACDMQAAARTAKEMDVRHEIIAVDELKNPKIMENPKNRCYLCKKQLFTQLLDFAKTKGVSHIIEGTNGDDLLTYRPGIQAIRELGIISPLADAGFTKEEVRQMARELGISTAERPSAPCLATRLPYGTKIQAEVLRKIEAGEKVLRDMGYQNVRIRVHGTIARLELDLDALEKCLKQRELIAAKLKGLGFTYITLDLEGFRSGSMDDV